MESVVLHTITIQYEMWEDGEYGVSCYDDDVPLVVGLGMLEAAKTVMNEAAYGEEDCGG